MKNETKTLSKMEIIELVDEAIIFLDTVTTTKENVDNIASIYKRLNLVSTHILMDLKENKYD